MKNLHLWALAIAVLVIVGGVAAYFLVYQGTLEVNVTDATGPWAHVWVTFSAVAIHESGQDNATWKTVSTATQTVDLASLTHGVTQLLGKASLTPGHYEQIRLTVVNATAQQNGSTQILTVTVPPDNATLKVPGQFTITSGQTTAVTIDIHLDASLHESNGTWMFTPVVGLA